MPVLIEDHKCTFTHLADHFIQTHTRNTTDAPTSEAAEYWWKSSMRVRQPLERFFVCVCLGVGSRSFCCAPGAIVTQCQSQQAVNSAHTQITCLLKE